MPESNSILKCILGPKRFWIKEIVDLSDLTNPNLSHNLILSISTWLDPSWLNIWSKITWPVWTGLDESWLDLTCPNLTCPDSTNPDLTCPDLTCPDLTCPDLTSPDLTCPDLTCPDLTCPDLTYPDITSPDLPDYHSDYTSFVSI